MKLPKMLSNKYVLYLVLVLAIVNAVCLIQERDFDSLLVLSIVGLLSSYFTKNMVIVLGVAMTVANFNYIQDHLNMRVLEGMDNESDPSDMQCYQHNKNKTGWNLAADITSKKDCKTPMCWSNSKDECGPVKQGFGQRNVPKSKAARVDIDDDDEDDSSRIDYAATIEGAYDNLEKMLGSDGMKGLTSETKKLVNQQKGLMKSLETMTPVLKSAKKTLDGLDLGGDIKGLQDMMAKLNGSKKQKKN